MTWYRKSQEEDLMTGVMKDFFKEYVEKDLCTTVRDAIMERALMLLSGGKYHEEQLLRLREFLSKSPEGSKIITTEPYMDGEANIVAISAIAGTTLDSVDITLIDYKEAETYGVVIADGYIIDKETLKKAREIYLGNFKNVWRPAGEIANLIEMYMGKPSKVADVKDCIRIAEVAHGSPDEQAIMAGHDYNPDWDYEADDNPDQEMMEAYDKAAGDVRRLFLKDFDGEFKGFRVSYVKGLGECLAKYVDGTYSYPIVVVDLNCARNSVDNDLMDTWGDNTMYNIAITTLMHELRHAWQDANGNGYDEEDAEHFCSRYSLNRPRG
jgi:hypothetical protein